MATEILESELEYMGDVLDPNAEQEAQERRIARLERELQIRDREERAARREMVRLTERLVSQSRATRAQFEHIRAEGTAAREANRELVEDQLREDLARERAELE